MREKIDLFLPCEDIEVTQSALQELHDNKTVQHINLLVSADFAAHHQVPDGCTFVVIDRLESSNTVESIAENTDGDSMPWNDSSARLTIREPSWFTPTIIP